MDSLTELLLLSAKQDAVAFRQLYQQAAPRLYALCLRILQDEGQAEDVLQEAFVKIWHHAPRYVYSKGNAMTWMSSIARNQALDKLRMAKSRPDYAEEPDYETMEFASVNLSPSGLAELSEEAQKLANCLSLLKPEQRHAIMQAFYYGQTHDELATYMNKPLGTVKAWVRRGLAQLRQCFA